MELSVTGYINRDIGSSNSSVKRLLNLPGYKNTCSTFST